MRAEEAEKAKSFHFQKLRKNVIRPRIETRQDVTIQRRLATRKTVFINKLSENK